MSEVSLGHEVIGFENAVNVSAVNAHSDTHDHLLWPFSNAPIDAKKVGTLERLEAEAGAGLAWPPKTIIEH